MLSVYRIEKCDFIEVLLEGFDVHLVSFNDIFPNKIESRSSGLRRNEFLAEDGRHWSVMRGIILERRTV